jgi:hypothetical protein
MISRLSSCRIQNYLKGTEKELSMSEDQQVHTEEFEVNSEEILSKIKELVHEGNIRRVVIKNEDGRSLIDVPLTVGVVGALLAPQLAAIGAIAALIARATLVVERVED